MSATEITLEALLASRERRQAMQRRLLHTYPGTALVVLTIVMPGACKQTRAAAVVAAAARSALEETFAATVRHTLVRDLCTGFELYLNVDLTPEEAKRRAVVIEEHHPLGRLMDIDVVGADGIPLSRGAQRKCLICDRPARECMRSQAHPLSELINTITAITDEYLLRP